MLAVWCVTMPDTERNFQRKRDAVAYLRQLTSDERIRPVIVRRCKGAYTFYGPGREVTVLRANIDNIGFASLRQRKAS
jgi:hypothetical protein